MRVADAAQEAQERVYARANERLNQALSERAAAKAANQQPPLEAAATVATPGAKPMSSHIELPPPSSPAPPTPDESFREKLGLPLRPAPPSPAQHEAIHEEELK